MLFPGVLYIVGIMMFPFGFGSDRVKRLCGTNSSPFFLDDCTLGTKFGAKYHFVILTDNNFQAGPST